MSRHIYLTGYRGSGKTTVAKQLSTLVGMPWVDLDAEIVSASGKAIADIFRDSGEAIFRDWESKVLHEWVSGPATIISLGGGAVLRPENRQTIKRTGFCVWLDAEAEELAQRISADAASPSQRPSLTGLPMLEEIRQVMQTRQALYEDVANLRLDTGTLSIEQVAMRIQRSLPSSAD